MSSLPSAPPPSDPELTPSLPHLLSSWKEIAAYLKKSVRTVQRWERCLGLPVHRPGAEGVVLAYQAELDRWIRQGGALPNGNGNGNGRANRNGHANGNGNGHANGNGNRHGSAAERFRRYTEARRRAALLCSAAGERLQTLQSTAVHTRALCASLMNGAALAAQRVGHSTSLPDQTTAPLPVHRYPNVTVDDGGRNVEAGSSPSQVA